MIKRFAQLTGATLALFSGAIAIAQAPQQMAATDTASPAMWRVADADSEFILLGTFHILPPALEWRTDALDAAMQNADAVYFEVEADTPEAQSKTVSILMTQGFNPPGVTLSSMLSDDETQKLKDITRSLGLPFSAVEPMRPWQAFLTLSVQFIVKQGFQPGSGVDSVLLAESRTLGKELRFFETLEQQLNLFTTLDPDTEKNLLVLTLQDWENQQQMFDDLFAAWGRGDTAFIDEIMNKTMREQTPKVYDSLIVKRNQAWAEEIATTMNNSAGTALIAVGAGHLVGDEHSVPALLKARGFDVSRYRGDDEIEDLLKQMETPE
ncbi:MAG: TraB/GumN family protein [Pseudomonadota bacterium]